MFGGGVHLLISRRRALPLALVLVVSIAGVTPAPEAAPGGIQTGTGAARPSPTVDPLLEKRLASEGTATAIVSTWDRSQLDVVEALGIRGRRMRVLPMLVTTALTRAQLDRLHASPVVRSVAANQSIRFLLEETTWVTKARDAWAGLPDGSVDGATGDGVHVAVIDSGIHGMHSDADNLVEFCEAAHTADDPTGVLCSPNGSNSGPAGPFDDARMDATDDVGALGHGSHVSGIIAGTGDASGGKDAPHSVTGMAPDAKLHVYSWTFGLVGQALAAISAYDDMIDKKLNHGSGVVAVNNSWSTLSPLDPTTPDYDPSGPIHIAIKSAYDAGILSVFAAGNSGPGHNTISSQCTDPWVVCVAASSRGDSIAGFSSRGRPSELADTNGDGVVGGDGDAPAGNHDRRIGQAYSLGVYRPTLIAPGANVLSFAYPPSAGGDIGVCREETGDSRAGCYWRQSGTSMAAPHVTGAAALITQAFRRAHGADPTPAQLTDILERSANAAKLPGYEAEEIGAGRLDATAAVALAESYPNGMPPANVGRATPPYTDARPGQALVVLNETGCAPTGGVTLRNNPVTGVPAIDAITGAGQMYGQHMLEVPPQADRLRISWDLSPDDPQGGAASFLTRVFAPGVDPDAADAPAGPARVIPAAESTNVVDLRAPEPGRWTVRIYVDAAVPPAPCNVASKERPKQTQGLNYLLTADVTTVTPQPQVTIDTVTKRDGPWRVDGSASYPTQWDGVTNWEVPGSSITPSGGGGGAAEHVRLFFDGNLEDGCIGDGTLDGAVCGGPFLREQPTPSPALAATWKVPLPQLLNADDQLGQDILPDPGNTTDRSPLHPNWLWELDAPTTVGGEMTVSWWAGCTACNVIGEWKVSLWADGTPAFDPVFVVRSNDLPLVPQRLEATIDVPTFVANEKIVLRIEPQYVDAQAATLIYYDGDLPCSLVAGEPCESYVDIPLSASDPTPEGLPAPANVRVTDTHDALRVAWDALEGAAAYQIHRSETPSFTPTAASLIAAVPGESCTSPNVPSWPTASFEGLCYADTSAAIDVRYYYRVVGVGTDGVARVPSLLSYGTSTSFDRRVRVRVDRAYGSQVWEYASPSTAAGTSWTYGWDRRELAEGDHLIGARSFTQGVGSAIVSRPENLAPVASDDAATTRRNRAVTVPVLGNDSDPDGDDLEVDIASETTVKGGTVALNDNGTVTYKPRRKFRGTDTFDYSISDGFGGTDAATVTIRVRR